MRSRVLSVVFYLFFVGTTSVSASEPCNELLTFSAKKLRSSEIVDFCQAFSQKALLIVNTASRCGFTPQFKELEKLHQKYGHLLAVVGFPSNDFNQEYDDSSQVADVCFKNYGVSFTVVESSSVVGANANDLFKALAGASGSAPEWNFNKYYVSKGGGSVTHFPSRIIGPELERRIKELGGLD